MHPTSHLHAADEPELVRAPAVTYASVSGRGSPGTDEFYRKKSLIGDIAHELDDREGAVVVEIQYWYPEGFAPAEIADFYSVNPIPSLRYRVLAAIPEDTTADDLEAARIRRASAFERDGDAIELLQVGDRDVVQVLHRGPFSTEFATLARLGDFARSRGLRRSGPHHELHLDGFTRDTPQDTLRTILRDPVETHDPHQSS